MCARVHSWRHDQSTAETPVIQWTPKSRLFFHVVFLGPLEDGSHGTVDIIRSLRKRDIPKSWGITVAGSGGHLGIWRFAFSKRLLERGVSCNQNAGRRTELLIIKPPWSRIGFAFDTNRTTLWGGFNWFKSKWLIWSDWPFFPPNDWLLSNWLLFWQLNAFGRIDWFWRDSLVWSDWLIFKRWLVFEELTGFIAIDWFSSIAYNCVVYPLHSNNFDPSPEVSQLNEAPCPNS